MKLLHAVWYDLGPIMPVLCILGVLGCFYGRLLAHEYSSNDPEGEWSSSLKNRVGVAWGILFFTSTTLVTALVIAIMRW